MTTVNTHFFNVPVRVFASTATPPVYTAYYDFPTINVTYPNATIVYQLIEAPANVTLGQASVTPAPAPFNCVTVDGGRTIVISDTDAQSTTEKTYQVHIALITPSGTIPIDPQIINSPIRR